MSYQRGLAPSLGVSRNNTNNIIANHHHHHHQFIPNTSSTADSTTSSSSSSSTGTGTGTGNGNTVHGVASEPRARARYSLFPPASFPSLGHQFALGAVGAAAGATKKQQQHLSAPPNAHADDRRLRRSKSRGDTPEDMQAVATSSSTITDDILRNGNDNDNRHGHGHSHSLLDSSSSSSPPAINPASIPARTSSTKALANGDRRHSTSPNSQRSVSVRKHKSLVSVPEERRKLPEPGEQEWMAQSRSTSHRLTASTSFSQAADKLSPTMISSDLINGTAMSWSSEKENILKGPFDYLESHPGKDIRSQMITAFNEWLQVPDSSLSVITKVVSMLHTASLLVDDVEDNSQLRRGIPVAHSIFGTAQTINSANYVYFCALQELLTLSNPEVIRIYTDELLNLHRGQGMDLFWRDTLTCPTEDDYLEMVGNKTGGLFRLAIKLMCCESPSHNHNFHAPDEPPSVQTNYVPLVNTIGLLFQILDDYKNLSDTTYTNNKGLCEDLTEGKFSFPIIHAIRSDPSNLVLINILKQKTTDDEVKRYAVAYMDRTGSFSYTRRVLRGLTKKALALVDEADAGRGRAEAIKGILEQIRVDKHSRTSLSA
ncbi:Geranylgeranyl pyrophosphate synthase [Lecanosticta acicola]|uniref:Geranylgeranyl pyrophosphate synthase n=1 Tax=Lecanosticta acicola TaxID=111012 RepID=A0AAI8Z4S1_9PEZI|nr:Geranylgeranyl pyrophosphate synthase [Lecanosticta acicola]